MNQTSQFHENLNYTLTANTSKSHLARAERTIKLTEKLRRKEIEKDNQQLLKRIMDVVKRKNKYVAEPHSGLASNYKKKEQFITMEMENMKMLNKIKYAPPTYKRYEWQQHLMQNEKFKDNIQKFQHNQQTKKIAYKMLNVRNRGHQSISYTNERPQNEHLRYETGFGGPKRSYRVEDHQISEGFSLDQHRNRPSTAKNRYQGDSFYVTKKLSQPANEVEYAQNQVINVKVGQQQPAVVYSPTSNQVFIRLKP
mmetsp:Transcript_22402/g.21568  ORF Transcript_22402/g.21568 Transcript_22402/m.21568 type:complete len:253 (-) Transcript_22402:74-832(-)